MALSSCAKTESTNKSTQRSGMGEENKAQENKGKEMLKAEVSLMYIAYIFLIYDGELICSLRYHFPHSFCM